MRIELQPAYLLHSRNYRDTSVIADFWTPEFGRISVLAKGARRRKGGVKHLLIPFSRLLLSCQGRGELKTLTHVEAAGSVGNLQQDALFSGFYLNELLLRLLAVADPHPKLFASYSNAIEGLVSGAVLEPTLRNFEWALLRELGYGFDFSVDVGSGLALTETDFYRLDLQRGFLPSSHEGFLGANLLAIARADYDSETVCRDAKVIARMALRPLLGDKPLNSREMFLQLKS